MAAVTAAPPPVTDPMLAADHAPLELARTAGDGPVLVADQTPLELARVAGRRDHADLSVPKATGTTAIATARARRRTSGRGWRGS